MHSVNTTQVVLKRMKVAIPKVKNNNRKTGFPPPPIPLEQSAYKDLQKDDYLTMKLDLFLTSQTHLYTSSMFHTTKTEHQRSG